MRVGIIGSGSLGSLFAAYLSKHFEIVLLGHWPEQMAALRKNGLTVIHPNNSKSQFYFPIIEDPTSTSPIDIALILVKSYQTERATVEAKSLLSSNGMAITLQNGLGNFEAIAKIIGADRVVQGVTAIGANMVKPGIVHYAGNGDTSIAHSTKNLRALTQMVTLFNNSGFKTGLVENIESLVWGKLAVNSAINPITALLKIPNGFIVSNSAAKNIVIETAEETSKVAKALGISLPYEYAGEQAIAVAQATAKNRSSMLQDILRGAPTEIDAICGQVVSYGKACGIKTPLNNEFYRLIGSTSDKIIGQKVRSKLIPINELLFAARNY